MNSVTINDLPNEILEQIFSNLSLDDCKSVTQVCQRWFSVGFQPWTVMLDIDISRFNEDHTQLDVLLASRRIYRHATFHFDNDYTNYELLLAILRKFHTGLRTLTMLPCTFVPLQLEFLQLVLSHCESIEKLYIDPCNFRDDVTYQDIGFKSLPNLRSLHLDSNLLELPSFDIGTLMPELVELHVPIGYYSDRPVQVLRQLYNQLTNVELWFLTERHFMSVCGLKFPRLHRIALHCVDLVLDTHSLIMAVISFFQDNPTVEQAVLKFSICAPILQSIAEHCLNLRYLCLNTSNLQEDCYRCFGEMKNLERLRLEDFALRLQEHLEDYPVMGSIRQLTWWKFLIRVSSIDSSLIAIPT
ncbi:uncharacterized protein LOC129739683 [Uranotaenia lowii]|uniref:uncharacterized protein LOC129739683 n=1 Tax=Uranotaenia lowii TaxID=190385 RepID=UPI00247A55BD|nr:uncharacterized protein LOC129739683 [Uranotaenia lowii]XP_055587155.1 uncharacterized protein LOC129739683 [Uranotaenia lowii]